MSADVPEAGSPFRPADDSDVVMSCRVRLARNVVGFPFVARATHPQIGRASCRERVYACV